MKNQTIMMKAKLFLLSLATVVATSVQAQVKTPRPSPNAEIEQEIGLTEIEVEYSRPSAKGREIFGGLVPYETMWRTGANAATTIKFDDDMKVEGMEIKQGKYSLFTIPGKEKWTIVFNARDDINVWDYDESGEVLRFDVEPIELKDMVETFTINFNEIRDDAVTMELIWEYTKVPIKITTNTDQAVMASIEKTMAGPEARDMYLSARYYYQNDKDVKQALEWIQKASELDPDKYWVEKWHAEILAANGKYKEAITVATKSMELAEKGGNDQYVEVNKENIEKWKKKL